MTTPGNQPEIDMSRGMKPFSVCRLDYTLVMLMIILLRLQSYMGVYQPDFGTTITGSRGANKVFNFGTAAGAVPAEKKNRATCLSHRKHIVSRGTLSLCALLWSSWHW
ncbi:hypothetical protein HYC85_005512 [Camellia sinensis]|uniref:Uncharacterized protein n=1 Tax=Camellia sinensis TaxID=4442 RepID=A0A7J7I0X3_CAMSI|nr:hypothetical protein HYC85_005512 [Camellia sinensis]